MDKMDILFQIKGLSKSVAQAMMKDKNIKVHPSPTQIMILNFMFDHKDEEIFQKDIEAYFGLSRATVSDVLNTMEKNNIINRYISSKDTRTKKVVLNESAFDKHNEAIKRMQEINSIITYSISEEDIEIFINVLKQMQKNLDSTTQL